MNSTTNILSTNSNTSRIIPELIIFNLDLVLWPFWSDFDIEYPCSNKNGIVIDGSGNEIDCFPDVPKIFERLKKEGMKMAILESTIEIQNTTRLIEAFGWNKYVSYQILHPGRETVHIKELHNISKIPYKKMLFFNDDLGAIGPLREMGVFCKFTFDEEGMSMKALDEALENYHLKAERT